MDGIINVYKPTGMTSFSCVSRVRKLTGSTKAGHAGTLDPEASGVLPICLGKATKCADMFLSMDKSYLGEITFGIETDTCDIWGQTVQSLDVNDEKLRSLTLDGISCVVKEFLGETDQVPPDYAAVKINGVPAYRLARKGQQFEMKSRRVNIYDIDVISFTNEDGAYPKALISVKCSRGTYIRSLFRDIGRKLGVPACMSSLERTQYGFMKASEAVTLDALESKRNVKIYPIGFLLKDVPYIELTSEEERLYRTGRPTDIQDDKERTNGFADGMTVRVYTKDGYLLSFAKAYFRSGIWDIKTEKFFDCKEDKYFE